MSDRSIDTRGCRSDAAPAPALPTRQTSRYILLDGLRGIAAVAVMLLHLFGTLAGGAIEHAFLAVDFFFMLSGFVIASAYDVKLRTYLSLTRFWIIRSIRLYPLVVPAVLAMLLVRLARPIEEVDVATQLRRALLNILLLPDQPTTIGNHFPLLRQSWSLFFELVVNLAYALAVRYITGIRLTTIIIVSAAGLIIALCFHDSVQQLQDSIPLGLLRTLISFALGVGIYRLLDTGRLPAINAPAWLICALLSAVLLTPSLGRWNAVFEASAILFVLPALVVVACRTPLSGRGAALATLAGELSYPIYILHMPVATYTGVLLGWLHPGVTTMKVLAGIVTMVASWLALHLYDVPVRRWLSRRLLARPVPEHPETAP